MERLPLICLNLPLFQKLGISSEYKMHTVFPLLILQKLCHIALSYRHLANIDDILTESNKDKSLLWTLRKGNPVKIIQYPISNYSN